MMGRIHGMLSILTILVCLTCSVTGVEECTGGAVWTDCGISQGSCWTNCTRRVVPGRCTMECYIGCLCPDDLLMHEGVCITHDKCPALPPCHEKRAYVSEGLPGTYMPSCEEDGYFSATQCHGSTGRCWCTDREGTKLPDTETMPGESMLSCEEEVEAYNTCRLPLRTGSCESVEIKYYYDIVAQECKPFNYTGCDGNDNKFETKQHCEDMCQEQDITCSGGKVPTTCGGHGCINTCRDPTFSHTCRPACTLGCECPRDKPLWDELNNICVTDQKQCPHQHPCNNHACPDGQTCLVTPFNCKGEYDLDCEYNAACTLDDNGEFEELCDKTNTSCRVVGQSETVCKLQSVQCITTPCDPVPVCVYPESWQPCAGDMQWATCGTACPASCDDNDLMACTLQCVQQCQCPGNKPLLNSAQECVTKADCPVYHPCIAATCPVGHNCVAQAKNCDEEGFNCDYDALCVLASSDDQEVCDDHAENCENVGFSATECRLQQTCDSEDQCTVEPVCAMPDHWKPCPGEREWNTCASACEAGCHTGAQMCTAQCVARCDCPPGKKIVHDGRCIAKEECPESECTGGRVHTQCNMCHKTCANPDRKCPDPSAQCEPGCECPYETQYWDETQQRCTTLDACQLTQGVSRTVASAACLLTICLALL